MDAVSRKRYATDLTDAQWELIAPILPLAKDGSLTNNLSNTVTTTISLTVTEVKISTTVSINAAGNIEIKDNVELNGIEFVRLAQCAKVEHEADYDAGKHCQRLNTPQ